MTLADLFAPAIADLVEPPAWHADAACREHPELDWFPARGESLDPIRAVCAGCLVREDCAAAAIDRDEKHGIWGGLSDRQRRAARRDGLSAAEALARYATPTTAPGDAQDQIRTA